MINFGEKITKADADIISPIVLAFVGDAVYTLFVREKLTKNCASKSGELNKKAVGLVNATAQAGFVKKIMERLTEEEIAVYKRARNAKKTTRAKSASPADYSASTGFEAVIGYLYLTGKTERLNEILNFGEEKEG